MSDRFTDCASSTCPACEVADDGLWRLKVTRDGKVYCPFTDCPLFGEEWTVEAIEAMQGKSLDEIRAYVAANGAATLKDDLTVAEYGR